MEEQMGLGGFKCALINRSRHRLRLKLDALEHRVVPSLVAAYGFEQGTGTTVADSSGNGLTGAITNASWSTAGRYGNALSFNGSNSWVTVADNALLHLTSGMTLEAWGNWRRIRLTGGGR